jgi:hypothetical protein
MAGKCQIGNVFSRKGCLGQRYVKEMRGVQAQEESEDTYRASRNLTPPPSPPPPGEEQISTTRVPVSTHAMSGSLLRSRKRD